MNYAIIENNIVINTVVADNEEVIKAIAGDSAYLEMSDVFLSVGDFFDNGKWYPEKPGYPCQWYDSLQKWATNEEILNYENELKENEERFKASVEEA